MKKTLLFLLTLFLSLAGYAQTTVEYAFPDNWALPSSAPSSETVVTNSKTNQSITLFQSYKNGSVAGLFVNKNKGYFVIKGEGRVTNIGIYTTSSCAKGAVLTVTDIAGATPVSLGTIALSDQNASKEYTLAIEAAKQNDVAVLKFATNGSNAQIKKVILTVAAGAKTYVPGFPESISVEAGSDYTFEPANGPEVSYVSDNEDVFAHIEGHQFLAGDPGTTNVTATWGDDVTWKKGQANIAVAVTKALLKSTITAAQDTYTIDIADENHATSIANPFTIDVEGATMAYASNNTAVATVAADGTITIVGQKGSATITATYAGDAYHKPAEASVTVTVKDSNVKGFVKVTSTAELTPGQYIIVANPKSTTEGYKAMSTTTGSSNISNVTVTVEEDVIAETEGLLHIILFKQTVEEDGQTNTYWHLWGSDFAEPAYVNGSTGGNNIYFNQYGTNAVIEVEEGVATIRYKEATNLYQILFQASNVNVFKNYKTSNLTGSSTSANYRTVSLYKDNTFVPVEVQKPIAEHDETAGTVTCIPADAQHRLWVRVETVMKDAAEPAAAAPTYPDMEESYWLPKENVEFTNVAPGKSYTVETPAAESNIAKVIVNARAYDVNGNLSGTMGEREITADGKITTSILDIDADVNAPVEFYNLQGVRVSGNEPGLYIRRQGTKVTKVLVK